MLNPTRFSSFLGCEAAVGEMGGDGGGETVENVVGGVGGMPITGDDIYPSQENMNKEESR